MNELVVLNKPKFGEPCNRCGECCRLSLCALGEMYFGEGPAPCPALELDGDIFACGLLRRADHYAGMNFGTEAEREFIRQQYLRVPISEYLGIGQGCGMLDET